MGLFSVIDLILDVPMSEALKMMNVSKNISKALVDKSGPYYDILYFMECYEAADWQEISRIMLLDKMDEAKLSDAYINTLEWYRDLF